MRGHGLQILATLTFIPLLGVWGAEPPKDPAKREVRVKTTTGGCGGGRHFEGIVAAINTDGLTLVERREFGQEPREHSLLPIDHLRAGKVVSSAIPCYAYCWEDVKPGDTVELYVAQDHIDKQMYCVEIWIKKRPKGRLPTSQREDDDPHLARLRLDHDIGNGEDVGDDEIAKAFPPLKEVRDRRGNLIQATSPGGLPKHLQANLDAIRAKKKDKDLKATPPEKK